MVASVEWVMLSYRVPREPSSPRIAIWRRLKRLGVAQVGDGVVALPADARNREQLEWVAEQVDEAGGSSLMWLARLTSEDQERRLIVELSTAREAEYEELMSHLESEPVGGVRGLKAVRAELRRIERRDYFPPRAHERARAAVRDLADRLSPAGAVTS